MTADKVRENVIIRGAIALLRAPGELTDVECEELASVLEPFDILGHVTDVELAITFLSPGPEQDLEEAARYLDEHLLNEDLLSIEERFAMENEERDMYNAFREELGEVVDPDEPY